MTNKEFFSKKWKHELKATVNMMRALPMEKLSYTPNPKSKTAKQLVGHIMGHPDDLIEMIDAGIINHRIELPFNSVEEAAKHYETKSEELLAKLTTISESEWETKMATMYIFGNKIYESTYLNHAWGFLFDVIHHRGQLSTYMRPMGVANTSVYGPTAEMMEK